MRKLTLLFVMLLLTASQQVYSQWVNGQNASYVIGTTNFTSNGNITSTSLAVDNTNNKLYSVDYCKHVVYRYALPITSDNPTAEITFGITNTSGTTQNTMNKPVSVTINDNGRLYVADGANNRILYWDNAYNINTNSPNADGVIGQTDFTSNSSGLSSTKFDFYVDATGLYGCGLSYSGYVYCYSNHLFVSDGGNNRVLRIDNDTSASVVYGQANFTTETSGLTQSTLNKPMGVAVSNSTLYVSDMGNNRVLRFDNAVLNMTNGANADAVYGQTSYTASLGGRTARLFDIPVGLAVDGKNRLYINDSNNGRVVTINNANTTNHAVSSVDFSNVIGQSDFTTYSATTTQSTMYAGTTGIAISTRNNNLFVGNTGATRILIFNASSALPLTISNVYHINNQINFKNNSYTYSDISLEVSEDGKNFTLYDIAKYGFGEHKFDISNLSSIYKYYRLKQVDESGSFYTNVYSFDYDKKYYYNNGYLDISGTTETKVTYSLYETNGVIIADNEMITNKIVDFKKAKTNSNILILKLYIDKTIITDKLSIE